MAAPSVAKLGRYEVIRHLASGGMAEVLLARAAGIEGFERYVVIKRIHIERARDPHVVKMFCDEARLAASMHHRNIVQVHDIGQEKGEYFFAMEYVHGEDLRRLLVAANQARTTIPTEHILSIVTAAAAALHYAHDHKSSNGTPLNIVHRDVSPANILVGYDGEVKVVDFGIAKASFRSAETQSGTLKGKISYMAPEQCLGAAVDRRSDVFALGIVLFELFTVRRLFKGSSDFLTMSAIVAGNTPKPSSFRKDTPPELEAIIMKALALDAADRYQSANELRLALEDYARQAGLRMSTQGLSDYMTALLGRRPEPWLAESQDADIEVSEVDFDGPASDTPNSTRMPTGMRTPPPGSLLARVRRKMAPAGGIEVTPFPPIAAPADDFSTTTPRVAPGDTGTGTPMAWSPGAPTGSANPAVPSAPKRRGLAIGVIAALVIVGVVLLRPWGGGGDDHPSVAPASTPEPLASPPPPPPSPAPPVTPEFPHVAAPVAPDPVASPEPVTPAPVASVQRVTTTKPVKATTKRLAVKKRITKSGPGKTSTVKPRYDPKSLFPK